MSTAIHEPPRSVRVGHLVPVPRTRHVPPPAPVEPRVPQQGEVRLLLSLGLGGAACLCALALTGFLLLPPLNATQIEQSVAEPEAPVVLVVAHEPVTLEPAAPELLPEPVATTLLEESVLPPRVVCVLPAPSEPPVVNLAISKPVIEPPPPKQVPPCPKFGTRIDFVANPTDAFKKAQEANKPVFFLHLSGNFEDKEFT